MTICATDREAGLGSDGQARCDGRGREEPPARRVRIRAAPQLEFDQIMSRYHPRVTGVKLLDKAVFEAISANFVHAAGHDQVRTIEPFGQETAHRTPDRACESHPLSVLGHDGEVMIRTTEGLQPPTRACLVS